MKRPQVMDLEPKDGSLDDKFLLNALSCGQFDSVVSLRVSRINHACISNACHYYEEKTKVKVVNATKYIKGKGTSTNDVIQIGGGPSSVFMQ